MHPVYVVCISPGFRTGGTDRGRERERKDAHTSGVVAHHAS